MMPFNFRQAFFGLCTRRQFRDNCQRGQATTETLISMLALVPILVLTPYLGKYLDVKFKTAEAARYASWERSIASDAGASWGSDENSKTDQRIALEARHRVLGDHRAPITTQIAGTASENPLWRDHVGDDLVSFSRFNQSASVAESDPSPLRGVSVDLIASGDSVAGIDIGLGLNKENKAAAGFGLELASLPDFDRRGAAIDLEVTALDDQATTTQPLAQSASLFTDSWAAGSEDNFADRIDGLVVDEVLSLAVLPGTLTFGNTRLFREGADGADPELKSESGVVPFRYHDRGDVANSIIAIIGVIVLGGLLGALLGFIISEVF